MNSCTREIKKSAWKVDRTFYGMRAGKYRVSGNVRGGQCNSCSDGGEKLGDYQRIISEKLWKISETKIELEEGFHIFTEK